jgi:hypothetical protein
MKKEVESAVTREYCPTRFRLFKIKSSHLTKLSNKFFAEKTSRNPMHLEKNDNHGSLVGPFFSKKEEEVWITVYS